MVDLSSTDCSRCGCIILNEPIPFGICFIKALFTSVRCLLVTTDTSPPSGLLFHCFGRRERCCSSSNDKRDKTCRFVLHGQGQLAASSSMSRADSHESPSFSLISGKLGPNGRQHQGPRAGLGAGDQHEEAVANVVLAVGNHPIIPSPSSFFTLDRGSKCNF